MIYFGPFSDEKHKNGQKLKNFFSEHFSIQHKGIKHYTLPKNRVSIENVSNFTYDYVKKFDNSRSFVNCSHFESELTCEEVINANIMINYSHYSNKTIIISLPNNRNEMIKLLHFALVLSITTHRKLQILNPKISVPKEYVINRLPNSYRIVHSNAIDFCDSFKLLLIHEKNIYLKGMWNIERLLLSPGFLDRIPPPFSTHGLLILSRLLFPVPNMIHDNKTLQIGISLQYSPFLETLKKVINRLHEGYPKYQLHIWNPNRLILNFNYTDYKKFEDAFPVLVTSDVYIGSLGFFESHWISAFRGRGGRFLNPKDTTIVETSSSQSGYLYMNPQKRISELICQGATKELQNFLLFQAV